MIGYTILSTPYSALSAVLSARSEERTTLISFRFIAAFAGGLFVSKYTLALVDYLGNGNEALGWQLTMAVYGSAAAIIFGITFAATKERIAPPADQQSTPLQDISDLFKNKAWLILFVLAMVIMMTITLRGGSSFYYLKYYVERPDLIPNYLFVQLLALLVGAASTPLLIKVFDKTKLLLILMALVALFSFVFFFVPKDAIWTMFALNICISLCLGPKSPLTWSMYADTADYNEWKTGRRATGMTFSAATFSQKLGGALGSAIMLWVLAAIGYVAKEAQTDASKDGIAILQTALPGVFAALAAAVIMFYPLTAEKLEIIQNELKARESETE
jgi:GPH family glycoside/pentoside/hexuronide:cation symporter